MKLSLLPFFVMFSILFLSCNSDKRPPSKNKDNKRQRIINPIPIDVKMLSGLDLKSVTNKDDPNRRQFQKQLVRGLDLNVYVVSSETATATHESYGIDKFLYVLNGRARLNPTNGDEVFEEEEEEEVKWLTNLSLWSSLGIHYFVQEKRYAVSFPSLQGLGSSRVVDPSASYL